MKSFVHGARGYAAYMTKMVPVEALYVSSKISRFLEAKWSQDGRKSRKRRRIWESGFMIDKH